MTYLEKVMQAVKFDKELLTKEQADPRYEAVKYAVACANLMPEAVELIKYLREKMLEDASWVQFDGEEKIYACDEELKRIDNFLAKLERETK